MSAAHPMENPIVVRPHHECLAVAPDKPAFVALAHGRRRNVRFVPIESLTREESDGPA